MLLAVRVTADTQAGCTVLLIAVWCRLNRRSVLAGYRSFRAEVSSAAESASDSAAAWR